jgi:hypothetical protein
MTSMALSGQEAGGDVAVGELRRRPPAASSVNVALWWSSYLAADALAGWRSVSSTRGRLDLDGLEAALERGVLLDVLAVFVERGRADALELAAARGRA